MEPLFMLTGKREANVIFLYLYGS